MLYKNVCFNVVQYFAIDIGYHVDRFVNFLVHRMCSSFLKNSFSSALIQLIAVHISSRTPIKMLNMQGKQQLTSFFCLVSEYNVL